MAAPRTTYSLRVRSYELRPDRRAGSVSFLNWFQEAAFANSSALGFTPERYAEMGVTWVMRESDLLIHRRPAFDEAVHVATWISELGRTRSTRQYEARDDDGALLARCDTEWAMIDLATLRPRRIPPQMFGLFEPEPGFVLEPAEWPTIETAWSESAREVAFYEEDELAHVNNAVYLNWIEESARRAEAASELPPAFSRHRLRYRQAARCGDRLVVRSRVAPHRGALAWEHEVAREGELLLSAQSLSQP